MTLPIPPWSSRVLLILTVTCLFFYILDVYNSIVKRKSFLPLKTHLFLVLPLIIYIAGLGYIDCNVKFGLQGRYFFPVISFLYIILISGLLSAVEEKKHLKYLSVSAVAAVLFNIYCLAGIILPRYYL
ncbi:MAG: hypothetical protein A2231_12245 [Candidatus Firestonebacteria bacterium RIFOXYA2_FULL_40_8]|nr:MAG: hypothetical protein A2231_12245 [Candidatus Firestonebacteria bacterium RIFOXYA2_FULL_40_8]